MAEKQRSLLVLDDPWMPEQVCGTQGHQLREYLIAARWCLLVPEQVRFLNPINSSQEHRLLVTTRIRDLVPKATRVELPLMGKVGSPSLYFLCSARLPVLIC